jgi:uncharacterized protein
MEIKTGAPVEGDDFFGREKELEYVWKRIKAGNNFILPSPRRVGKTSFVLKLLVMAEKEGWKTISLNLERNKSEQAFVEELLEEIKKISIWEKIKSKGTKLTETFKNLKPTFEHGDYKVSLEWNQVKDDIYKQLAEIIDHEKPTLIFMDELTVLLSNILKQENGHFQVSNFLHWMRDLRIQSGSKIRWVYCSSVGIENFTHLHNISATLNDVTEYMLKSFDAQTSKSMMKLLGESNDLKLKDEIQNEIIEKLAYTIPYFIQLVFEKILYFKEVEDVHLNTEIVQLAYDALTIGSHFNPWIERINIQYESNTKYAFSVLKFLCQEKNGVNRESLMNSISNLELDHIETEILLGNVIYMLSNDGYILNDEGLYRFRSPLLRDFWLNRFVQ